MKRLGFYGGLILLAFAVVAVAAYFAYADKVKKSLLEALNQRLGAELSVEEIGFSIVDNFPEFALRLDGLRLSDPTQSGAALTEVARFYLAVDLWSLLDRRLVVRELRLEEGRLRWRTYADGRTNFDILRPGPQSSQSTGSREKDGKPVAIALESIVLKNMRLDYRNDLKRQHAVLHLRRMALSGSFASKQFEARLSMEAVMERLRLAETTYLRDQAFGLRLGAAVDQQQGRYTLNEGRLDAFGSSVVLSGEVQASGDAAYRTDLEISSPGLNLHKLLRLVPERFLGDYAAFEARGRLSFGGTVEGVYSRRQNPVIDVSFDLAEGYIAKPDVEAQPIQDLTLQGRMLSRSEAHPQGLLSVAPFSVRLGEDRMEGQLRLDNFSNPRLRAELKGALSLGWLSAYVRLPDKAQMQGRFEADAQLDVSRRDQRLVVHSAKGELGLTEFAWLPTKRGADSLRLKALRAQLRPAGASLMLHRARWRESEAHFDGQAPNLWRYLVGEDSVLKASGHLALDYLPLGQLLKPPKGKEPKPLELPRFVRAELSLALNHLQFDPYEARSVQGQLVLNDTALVIEQFRAQTLDGEVSLKGHLAMVDSARRRLHTELALRELDLHRLLAQTDNLGQDQLRAEHLQGRLNAGLELRLLTDSMLKPHMPSLRARLDFSLKEGLLSDFKPVVDLVGFVRPKTLRELKFYDLHGRILFEQDSLFIDQFVLNSSAVDLQADGSLSRTSKQMDIHARVKLSTLLRDEQSEQALYERVVEKDGDFFAFLQMKGPLDDPSIGWDKSRGGQQFKASVQEEGKELQEASERRRRRVEARRRRKAASNKSDTSNALQSVKQKLQELF